MILRFVSMSDTTTGLRYLQALGAEFTLAGWPVQLDEGCQQLHVAHPDTEALKDSVECRLRGGDWQIYWIWNSDHPLGAAADPSRSLPIDQACSAAPNEVDG